ncbi:MAG TPA: hypothetical protein DCQ98_04205 [Planctomycetaceae bacterium]|nr:hypothetical protein [Planctomycetaceae bacterium]
MGVQDDLQLERIRSRTPSARDERSGALGFSTGLIPALRFGLVGPVTTRCTSRVRAVARRWLSLLDRDDSAFACR